MSGANSYTADDLQVYLAARDRALVDLDVDWLAKNMPQIPPDIRLMVLHKARYEAINVADDLRHASRAWLAERGLGRAPDGPLLPEGDLPE